MRTLIAAAILPFPAVVLVPALLLFLDPWRQPIFIPGIIPVFAGAAALAFCIKDFFTEGRGTLAPWDPPSELVVTGMYRYCRNPMYLGILLTVAGLVLFFTSPLLLLYNILLAAAFHLRVIRYEEPVLRREFGSRWTLYAAMVNRWLPKI